MKKRVCVLFGGVSPEHAVSLRSAETVLTNLDPEQYEIFPVGITKRGAWLLFGSTDYAQLPDGRWESCPENRRVAFSTDRDQCLIVFDGDEVVRQKIDVVCPALHGENGEDGSIQGLMQLAGIPCVGSGVAASAAAMDKCLTKLVADHVGVRQADWLLVTRRSLMAAPEKALEAVEEKFSYPVFVKPAGTGSSVGVSKARDREALLLALHTAAKFDEKVLVEEFIDGREVECAVLGNETPVASLCGEIDSGVEFYDYDAKYVTDTAKLYIPARISDAAAEQVRETAVRIYQALGCRGLSRVDFFVTVEGEEVVFNEINTLPGFTSISMYPKLFDASGIPLGELIDKLLALAMEGKKEETP